MMKFKKYVFTIILIFFSITLLLNAQEKRPAKLGLQLSGLYPVNEFSGYDRFSYLARGFGRIHFSNYLGLEIGAGFGEYKGLDDLESYYGTTLIPLDLRLLNIFSMISRLHTSG